MYTKLGYGMKGNVLREVSVRTRQTMDLAVASVMRIGVEIDGQDYYTTLTSRSMEEMPALNYLFREKPENWGEEE